MRDLMNISLTARDSAQITDYQDVTDHAKATIQSIDQVLSLRVTPRTRAKVSLDSRNLNDNKFQLMPSEVNTPTNDNAPYKSNKVVNKTFYNVGV